MVAKVKPDRANKYLLDTYIDWAEQQGVPIERGYGIDLMKIDLKPWDFFGMKGAVCEMIGGDDFISTFCFELPPGGQSRPLHHLYEEVIYVLEGQGMTQVTMPDGSHRTFEWNTNSLFQVPLNLTYQHFNASGQKPARLVSTNNLRFIMNQFRNNSFIWDNYAVFQERFGQAGAFSGEGELKPLKPGRHQWETNFVADVSNFELKPWDARGPGSTNLRWILADGSIGCHTSQMLSGTYKKAHRHTPGTNVFCVSGHGYTLLWYEGDKDFLRVDWQHGVMYAPGDNQFHQHFNLSGEPSRYLAVQYGTIRYPILDSKRQNWGHGVDRSLKDGGNQIEYPDQDSRIHETFLKNLRENGVPSKMGHLIDEKRYHNLIPAS